MLLPGTGIGPLTSGIFGHHRLRLQKTTCLPLQLVLASGLARTKINGTYVCDSLKEFISWPISNNGIKWCTTCYSSIDDMRIFISHVTTKHSTIAEMEEKVE